MSGMFGTGVGPVPPPDGGLKSPLATKSGDISKTPPTTAPTESGIPASAASAASTAKRASEAVATARQVRQDGAGSAARSTATKAAKKKAASVASKAGVVAADTVLDKPRSAKAWGEMAARTGVAWILKPLGGKRSEKLIAKFGYARLAIALMVTALLSVIATIGLLLVVTEVVTSTLTKPAAIAQSVVDRILGRDPDDQGPEAVPDERMCAPVPRPQPAVLDPESLPTPSTTTSAPSARSGSPNATTAAPTPETFTPNTPLDSEGHLTPESARLMRQVPRGADPVRVETWLLYALSHPTDDPRADWDRFGDAYEKARITVRSSATGATRSTSAAENTETDSDPLALIMVIDDNPDYLPFVLPASAITAAMIYDEQISPTPAQQEAVLGRMLSACKPVSPSK